jgi:hypothetical protein
MELTGGEMCDLIEDYTGKPDVGDALKYLKMGYDRFLRAADWSFLKPEADLDVWPSVAVAAGTTVSGSTTTVTASAASFYASMIGHSIVITDTGTFTITAYTSSTVITISGDATCTAKTFAITADGRYAMPADFGGILEGFTYERVSGENFPDLREVSPTRIDRWRRDSNTTGDPKYWSTQPRASFSSSTGQRWDAIFYPVTDTARTFAYRYRVLMDPPTDSDSVYLIGGADFSYVIVQQAKAEAEFILGHTDGVEDKKAYDMLAEAIGHDRRQYGGGDDAPESLTDVDTGIAISEAG